MGEVQDRLVRCFLEIFPDLSEGEVLSASSATLQDWDSVTSVTLLAVIEEEFDRSIHVDDLSEFNSFQQFLDHVNAMGADRRERQAEGLRN